MRHLWLLPFCISPLLADTNFEDTVDIDTKSKEPTPWFTGPLLTPSPHVIPLGHFNFEPYLFVNNDVGFYNNSWHIQRAAQTTSSINFQYMAQFGIVSWVDMTVIPQFYYNYHGDKGSWGFGDLLVGIDIQLVEGHHRRHIPTVKFTLNELFPTGKYQHLGEELGGINATGGGSFATNFQLSLGTHWYFTDWYILSTRSSLGVTFYTQTSVRGHNAYGGDIRTDGTVYPGTQFPLYLAFEFSFTRHIALALDIVNTVTLPTRFKGYSDTPVGNTNFSYVLSFAPAFEFNFNENVGFIFGVWVSAIGTNTNSFINYVMALNWFQ